MNKLLLCATSIFCNHLDEAKKPIIIIFYFSFFVDKGREYVD